MSDLRNSNEMANDTFTCWKGEGTFPDEEKCGYGRVFVCEGCGK